jgi:hypothetical protein
MVARKVHHRGREETEINSRDFCTTTIEMMLVAGVPECGCGDVTSVLSLPLW